MEVLNALNYKIDVVHAEGGVFSNWYKLEYKLFKIIPSNTTKENHIFEVNNYKPEKFCVSELDGESVRAFQMKKTKDRNEYAQLSEEPEFIDPPIIQYIKFLNKQGLLLSHE